MFPVALSDILSAVVENVITFTIMVVLSIIGFYIAVFIVGQGATLAGYAPDGNFIVLSATLLVVASVLAGAMAQPE